MFYIHIVTILINKYLKRKYLYRIENSKLTIKEFRIILYSDAQINK